MAILSVSRRTDIPTFFWDWFMNRLADGNLMVRNPMNRKQISEIELSKDTIDCIVFWTKNPIPVLPRLGELNSYGVPYYFQFTITGYGRDIEANVPDKHRLVEAFKDLCTFGSGHVIWRYDPIVFNAKYTPEYHIRAFKAIASELKGFTDRCVISFVDIYPNNKTAIVKLGNRDMTHDDLVDFCKQLSQIAGENGMKVGTCAEVVDLDECGIIHNKCIDPDYIEQIIGLPIKNKKDGAQRKECGCIESIDIGAYNTCKNGCKYCYACKDPKQLEKNFASYDPNSPLLCDSLQGDETITKRKLTSMVDIKAYERDMQTSLF